MFALVFVVLAFTGGPAGAQKPPAPAHGAAAASPVELTPAEAQHLIEVLQDPAKRSELIATLRALTKAAPSAAPPPEPPAGPAPGPAPPPAAPGGVTLAPDSLGAQLLADLSGWPGRLADEAAVTVQTLTDFPLLWGWAGRVVFDPGRRAIVLDALWQVIVIVGCALLLGRFARTVATRPVAALAAHAPALDPNGGIDATARRRHLQGAWQLLRRLPFAVARLILELIPVGVFWGLGSMLAGIVPDPLTRFAILIAVNAYATARAIVIFGDIVMSPDYPRLRLIHIGDDQAAYLMRWLRRSAFVAVLGSGLASLALLFGLNQGAYETLLRIVGLIVAVMAAIVVLQSRSSVATWLRTSGEKGDVSRWRFWLAGAWHYLAIAAIFGGWLLWAAGIRQGLGSLRLLIGTVALLVAARLAAIVALGLIDRAARPTEEKRSGIPGAMANAARYHATARLIVLGLIVCLTAVALLQLWGADALFWFAPGQIGARLVSALGTVAVAAVVAIIVWEGANAALERRLARLSEAGPPAHSARLRTLLPLLRAALFTTILAVVGLTALSEVGVNIAPLLAGAGIVGVAIGFGAQKLVQDVITGMFVLLENAIQIGDNVTVAGLSGSVEQLSVRNIWLRGGDGAVHIVPFSAVTSITNSNRGLGNAAVSVLVAFKEDADGVCSVLRDLSAEMRADPDFAPLILGDLTLWVDSIKATGVTITGQIACTDAGRFAIQHEFNRRMLKRFQELGVELGSEVIGR